jgi:intracellular septation protein A
MQASQINTFISLAFAPVFVLALRFFSFENVSFVFAVIMFVYTLFILYKKESLKTLSTPLIYFIFVLFAYYYINIAFVKLIPALISGAFFLFFLNAAIQKKSVVLHMFRRFSKREIEKAKEEYIAKSDGYWAGILLLNTLIQLLFLFYGSNEVWAFYSSVGWYVLLFIALVLQILYAKIFYEKRGLKNEDRSNRDM